MASQGLFSFPGLADNLGAEMVLHRGITPSVATVWIPRRQQVDLNIGTMQWTFGSDPPVVFSGAVPHVAHLKQDIEFPKRPPIQKVMIYDRRINWTKGSIRGEYNRRNSAGTLLNEYKNNAKNLCIRCLETLGEIGYDVSAVPTNLFPYVNWNASKVSPGHALAWICEYVSCTINMVNDVVVITPYGTGASMPAAGRRATQDVDVYPKTRPSQIRVVGSPTVFQSKLKCAGRGIDTDGVRRSLATLTYKPASGWSYQWPMAFGGVAIANRRYAFESVFRWYQVIGQSDGSLTPTNCPEVVTDVRQYWPLLPDLMTGTALNSSLDQFDSLPPYIEGKYWPRCDHPINTPTTAAYTGDFTVDRNIGMVRTNQPVFQINTGGLIEEAELYLICCYNVTKADRTGKIRLERTQAVPAGGAGELVLYRPELFYGYIQYPSTTDNVTAMNTEADAYLTAFAARYAVDPVKDAEYDGFPISGTDGKIAQLTFSVGRNRVCTTRVSQNEEMNIFSPDFKERRRREIVEASA